jgi:hypothetical protein
MAIDFEPILHRLESDAAFSTAELDGILHQAVPSLAATDASDASDVVWALVVQRRHTPALLPLAKDMLRRGDDGRPTC